MVTKVVIRDNKRTPFRYISELDNFANGKTYEFKAGVNVIVGENGCGKTTLLNLIKTYLMVDYTECNKGMFNSNINSLFMGWEKDSFLDGVDVYADYEKNTFRLSHAGEKLSRKAIETISDFSDAYEQSRSSTGQGVLIAISSLFNYIFSKKAKLNFDYSMFADNYKQYYDYTQSHKVSCDNEWTILMDEPDRNLSIDNIVDVKGVLSFHKPYTQIISVVHNPLLIYALSKCDEVNFIEMTDGYINKVKKTIKSL